MEKGYGRTIDNIRLQKGISIKQLIDGVMDASTYHRFKNSDIDTTVSKFITLLNRLNIRFDEFIFIHQNYKQDVLQDALIKLQTYYNEKNEVKLKRLLHDIQKQQWDNLTYQEHMKELVEVHVSMLHKQPYNIQNLSLIQYLDSVSTWTHYEVAMFSNCLKVLPTDTIERFLIYMVRSFSLYQGLDSYEQKISKLFINVLLTLLTRKEVGLARKWYNHLRQWEINDHHLFEKYFIKLLSVYLEKAEGTETSIEKLEKFEIILHELGCERLEKNIRNTNQWMVEHFGDSY